MRVEHGMSMILVLLCGVDLIKITKDLELAAGKIAKYTHLLVEIYIFSFCAIWYSYIVKIIIT